MSLLTMRTAQGHQLARDLAGDPAPPLPPGSATPPATNHNGEALQGRDEVARAGAGVVVCPPPACPTSNSDSVTGVTSTLGPSAVAAATSASNPSPDPSTSTTSTTSTTGTTSRATTNATTAAATAGSAAATAAAATTTVNTPSPGVWVPSSWRAFPAKQQAPYATDAATQAELARVHAALRELPALVAPAQVDALRAGLAACAAGQAFCLTGGDCAESFAGCTAHQVRSRLRVLRHMRAVLADATGRPVVVVARMAGQYAKPRSSAMEPVPDADGGLAPCFRGENVNGAAARAADRAPDPERLLRGYYHSAATRHLAVVAAEGLAAEAAAGGDVTVAELAGLVGRAAVADSLRQQPSPPPPPPPKTTTTTSVASSAHSMPPYTAHEALELPLEEALTRPHIFPSGGGGDGGCVGDGGRDGDLADADAGPEGKDTCSEEGSGSGTGGDSDDADDGKGSGGGGSCGNSELHHPHPAPPHYNLSAHFVWVGDRTRQLGGAHVEYVRGLRNPVGIKAGPSLAADPAQLVALVERLCPRTPARVHLEPGRVSVITRLGAAHARARLPGLLRAALDAGIAHKLVWVCDPCHGNTRVCPATRRKFRPYDDVLGEVAAVAETLRAHGLRLGGVHLELCGEPVTECTGGPCATPVADVGRRFGSLCDPRLSYTQSVAAAFDIAALLRQRDAGPDAAAPTARTTAAGAGAGEGTATATAMATATGADCATATASPLAAASAVSRAAGAGCGRAGDSVGTATTAAAPAAVRMCLPVPFDRIAAAVLADTARVPLRPATAAELRRLRAHVRDAASKCGSCGGGSTPRAATATSAATTVASTANASDDDRDDNTDGDSCSGTAPSSSSSSADGTAATASGDASGGPSTNSACATTTIHSSGTTTTVAPDTATTTTIVGLAGKPVPAPVFGTLFLARTPHAFALLDAAWARGVRAFDCAAVYGGGECEVILGRWLVSRRVPREEVVLISKGGCHGQDRRWAAELSRAHVTAQLKASLRRLRVKRLDVYLLHRDDARVPVGEVVRLMHDLCAMGHFAAWGVSNWARARLRAAHAFARAHGLLPPAVDSLQFSLATPSRPVWPDTTYLQRRRARSSGGDCGSSGGSSSSSSSSSSSPVPTVPPRAGAALDFGAAATAGGQPHGDGEVPPKAVLAAAAADVRLRRAKPDAAAAAATDGDGNGGRDADRGGAGDDDGDDALDWYRRHGVAVLAWECLAKGFCAGRWGAADAAETAARAAAVAAGTLAPLEPTGATADQWRTDQLVAAYCTPGNLTRRRRAQALGVARGGLSAAQVALRYVVSHAVAVVLPVVGTTSLEHLEANLVGVRGAPLSCKDVRYLEDGNCGGGGDDDDDDDAVDGGAL